MIGYLGWPLFTALSVFSAGMLALFVIVMWKVRKQAEKVLANQRSRSGAEGGAVEKKSQESAAPSRYRWEWEPEYDTDPLSEIPRQS